MSKSWSSRFIESQLAKDKCFKVLNYDVSALVTDSSMVTMSSRGRMHVLFCSVFIEVHGDETELGRTDIVVY